MRNRLAAALLLAALSAPASAASVDLFPRPNEIFPLLIADPRHTQLSASYYRLNGQNTSDIGLGYSWGLTRWRSGSYQDWLWEADVEGMAYSRFQIGGGINEFETVDFFANLPVTVRRGDFAFKGTLFHESSHLGDDYIRETGNTGFRYSNEGVRLQASIEPRRWIRFYGGAQFLLHDIPVNGPWSGQAGLEYFSDDLRWSKRVRTRFFLAQDFQSHQDVQWNVNSHTVTGLKFNFPESLTRAVRLQLGYFDGHSPFGQFYTRREHYADVSFAFEL
ncbi:MAG TPA: DUF1207 domain-containing protein [Elusimicrobiota bacterium]|nr:DUF1207 domain-containing protein [Elusimicrobiota bacterium]